MATPTVYDAVVDGVSFASSQSMTDCVGSGQDMTVAFSFATALLASDGTSSKVAHKFFINDTVRLCKLPRGAHILDWGMRMPDIDAGTTLTWDLGLLTKAASTQAFVAASVAGRSGTISTVGPVVTQVATVLSAPATTVLGALPYPELTVDDTLILTAHAATQTAGAGGTISGWIRYHCRSTGF